MRIFRYIIRKQKKQVDFSRRLLPMIGICCGILFFAACDKETIPAEEFTGRTQTYQLIKGSEYDISGTITFEEKVDLSTRITISLSGTSGDIFHPAHLHHGTVDDGGEMAAMLTPVDGATGKSVTELTALVDGAPISYAQLIIFNGSIKVHLDDAANKDIILAYNNIGSNPGITSALTREITLCKMK